MLKRLLSVCLLGLLALVAGCGAPAPGEDEVRKVVEERLAGAFSEPVVQLTQFKRLGAGPLSPAAGGEARRLVYYDAELTLQRDFDFSSWQTLNVAAFANLLGATEKGISGLRQGGNKQGDRLQVHGSVTFVDMAGNWQPQAAVRTAVGKPPPEDNTGPPAVARQIIESIQALFTGAGPAEERRQFLGRLPTLDPQSRAVIGVRLADQVSEYVAPPPPPGTPPEAYLAAVIASRRERDQARLHREAELRRRLTARR